MGTHTFTGRVDDLLELHKALTALGGSWDDYAVTVRPPEVEVRAPDHVDPAEVALIVGEHLRAPSPPSDA